MATIPSIISTVLVAPTLPKSMPGAAERFDAIFAQYESARYRQAQIAQAMRGAAGARAVAWERVLESAVEETTAVVDRLVTAPAVSVMAFARKLAAVRRDGDWDEHADALIAEAWKLGGLC